MAEQRRTISRGSTATIWFGLLGGAAAWTCHLLTAYVIAEFACVSGKDRLQWMAITAPAWWLLILSFIMATIAVAASLAARRLWLRLDVGGQLEESQSPHRYLARVGFLLSGLFALIITIESIPILFYLRSC